MFRIRFSLRTLLILVAILGVALGWLVSVLHRIGHQRGIVATVLAARGSVRYNYEVPTSCGYERRTPPGPAIVRWFLGDDAYADVTSVSILAADDASLERLHELPQLDSIGAVGSVTDDGLASIVKVKKLESLYLKRAKISARGLSTLQTCQQLEILHLAGPEVDDAVAQGLDELTGLRHLTLYDTALTPAGLEPLRSLMHLEKLLVIRPGKVNDNSFKHVASLNSLKDVYLYQVPIGDAAFEHLGKISGLKRFELHKIPITSAAAENIARLQNLTFLAIEEAPQFGDSGCAQLAKLKELVELNLRVTGVTDAGMQHVATLTNLRDLTLSNTALTDAGMYELRTLTRLSHLRIGSNVTTTGVERFQKALPACHVTVDDATAGQKTFPALMQ